MIEVLIVDDDFGMRRVLRKALSKNEDFKVVGEAENGLVGIELFKEKKPDVVFMDVEMPEMNGCECAKNIFDINPKTKIIFATAYEGFMQEAFDVYAFDYLVKPFAFVELLARIRNILRRNSQSSHDETTLQIENLQLDLLRRRAYRDSEAINLTAKEFSLLELLMQRKGEVLSRSLIASQVWDMNFDSDTNVIDVAIRRLRNKVDKPFEPKLIHTIRGMGYVLDIIDDNEIA